MRLGFRRFGVAGMGVFLLMLSAACGGISSSAPDYGPYPVGPGDDDFDRQPNIVRGVFAESLRLGDHIIFATDIDPDLTAVRDNGVTTTDRGLGDTTISTEQRVTAVRYGVVGGFSAAAANRPDTGDGQPRKYLSVSLTAFHDEQAAAAAAAAMERVDLEANTDNLPVALAAFPAAMSHWRPGVPSLGSVMAWKTLVIHVYAELPDPDLGRLADTVTTVYRKQLTELDSFDASAVPDTATVPLDPDRLLARLVRTGEPLADQENFAAFGVRAYSSLSATPATEFMLYTGHGVTALAVSYNKFLYRLRDAAAATEYGRYLADSRDESEYTSMSAIRGVPAAACSQATRPDLKSLQARRYRCVVVRDSYVAVVYSAVDTDVRQLAAAQYSAMANPR
ncbi:hypothetical protein ACIRRA_00140 [Nocardia sp. NPDC101769]|uniref:DUF7373 family lipoprotein n=1 Tax=Nocardia sp. NPDC101769 TaxID=3364333 RepID=UPI003801A5A8